MEWNVAQRTIAVVGYGLALLVLWQWLDLTIWGDRGWFAYAPNSGVAFSPADGVRVSPDYRPLAQLGFVTLWFLPSIRFMRSTPSTHAAPTEQDPS